MYCGRRLYKGNSYEICLPLTDTGITTVSFYTSGDVIIEKEPETTADTMCFLLTKEDLDALQDGVLRYSYEDQDSNTSFVIVTPGDYSGSTLDDLLDEAYESGYTQGLEECSVGSEDLIANLQGDYFIIPEGTTNLRPYALYDSCYSAITVPDSVEYIGGYAFGYNDCLTHMTIPSSVSGMGEAVFMLCRNLEDVTFENTLSSIPVDCFSSCYSLTGITFPSGVTAINEFGFNYCLGLSGITIPDTITEIKRGAFRYCSGLTEITIPSGVTKIPRNCFDNCISLTSITIPSGITVFEGFAFGNCHKLSNVVLPEDLEIISGYAFDACYSITSVTFPENVSYIGSYAFRSCSGITEMTFDGDVPPTLASTSGNGASLGSTDYNFPIFVPCDSIEAYQTAFGPDYAPRIMCREG